MSDDRADCAEVVDTTGTGPEGRAVGELARAVLVAEGAHGRLGVTFVDEATITDLNRRYRDLDEPTDVLSFPAGGFDSAWPGVELEDASPDLGEVVICTSVVEKYAAEAGSSTGCQLAWTLIHGVLHLLGYDHEADAGQMRLREQDLLETFRGFSARLQKAADSKCS